MAIPLSAKQRRLTRRSTRTPRVRGFARAASRQLACIVTALCPFAIWEIRCATELHSSKLKPLDFGNRVHSFLRERVGYVESYQLQGSSWNAGEEPWRFYLNVRVRFPDVMPLYAVLVAHAHIIQTVSIEGIVSGSAPWFELNFGQSSANRERPLRIHQPF